MPKYHRALKMKLFEAF